MTLKEKIDKLNRKKGIKSYVDLLRRIHIKLKTENAYDAAKKEKSNFTQMIEGHRPLKKEYYIPLEQIYNVSIDYLLNGVDDDPKVTFNNCGLRYTASTNNYSVFERLGTDVDSDDSFVIFNSDEYNKNIFDYIIEYEAIEGIRYLLDTFDIKYNSFQNAILAKKNNCYCNSETVLRIFEMLIDRDDIIYSRLFDSYDLLNDYYNGKSLFKDRDSMEKLLKTDKIFKSLLSVKEYTLPTINYGLQNHDNDSSLFVNPIINTLLSIAMEKPVIYKDKLEKIIDFAIEKNKEIIDYVISHYDDGIDEFRVNEEGFILVGHTKYGLIVNPGEVINPSIEGWLKAKISEVKQINDKIIYHDVKDFFGNNHKKIKINEKGHVLKLSSNNELEYLLYKEYENALPIPKYYGTSEGIDEFEKYRGSQMSYSIGGNVAYAIEIAKFLKLLHNTTMTSDGKVYVHGEMKVDNFYFTDAKLTDVVNWDETRIGNIYEDMIDLLINLSGMKERYRDNNSVLDNINKIFDGYGATEEYKETCLKMLQSYLENVLKNFDNYVYQSEYARIYAYESYMWCKAFVDIYYR